MFTLAAFVLAAITVLATDRAWAAYSTCVSNVTVSSVNTWYSNGAPDNGDKNDRYSVLLSNGKNYTAADDCNSNDSCGQANLSPMTVSP
jgi:hypothetical protein